LTRIFYVYVTEKDKNRTEELQFDLMNVNLVEQFEIKWGMKGSDMDLAYFKKLFDYDYWATERLLTSLEATASPTEEAIKKMSHVLSAKEVWMGRLLGTPFHNLNQLMSAAEGRKLNEDQRDRMNAYLSRLDERQLSEKVAYQNLKGLPFETVLSDILAHMVNHGSYHRGQIASFIKKSSGEPAGTDYIGFVREYDAKR